MAPTTSETPASLDGPADDHDCIELLRWTVERSSTREKVARQILERALANQKELGRQARARQQDLMDYTDQIPRTRHNTIKIKDPEPLDNGSNPRYADWKAAVERKMELNAYFFPDEFARITWIATLIKGQAHEVLAPYLAKQDDLEIRSVGQIFELLGSVYDNKSHKWEARQRLDSLKMKQGVLYRLRSEVQLHKKLTGRIRLNSQDIYERYEELTFAQYRDRMTARYLDTDPRPRNNPPPSVKGSPIRSPNRVTGPATLDSADYHVAV
ncbi:hypothetical protein HRG_012701 [Hirsutella rhossiliensis]